MNTINSSEALLPSIIDGISDGVMELNGDGKITYTNNSLIDMFDLNNINCKDKYIEEVLPYRVSTVIRDRIKEENIQKDKSEFVTTLSSDSSNKLLEITIYPSNDTSTFILVKEKDSTNLLKEHKKLQLLTDVANHMIEYDDSGKVIDVLFHELSELLNLDICINYRFSSKTNKLKLSHYIGISQEEAEDLQSLNLGEAVCGYVAQQKEKHVAENIQKSTNSKVYLLQSLGMKAYVCCPLIAYGKLIGTLSFGSKERENFTEKEIELISKLCERISLILDRSYLLKDLKDQQVQLEELNRVKIEFLNMISHELRTPLNSILGYAQILEEQLQSEKEEPLEKIQKITAAGTYLLQMINDIICTVKNDSVRGLVTQEEFVNLHELMSQIITLLSPQAERKSILFVNYINDDINVFGYELKLKQIFINLLTNAIKFSPKQSVIVTKSINLETEVVIQIIDNGIGISDEEKPKIFEPFYRVYNIENNIEGSGLGLTIAKTLVEELAGSIEVESQLEKGSTFSVSFPKI
ncbi:MULTISPECIES: ATP-binding protein [Bacillus]|uniref:ATP-binding protein n=1 Tax=Bacillus TaxID=1386 RepID=UPI00159716AB|nr:MULTISPECIES: ATP-binding protein [Bacillus]